MICRTYRLGLVEYQEAWQLQEQLAAQIATGEHPPSLLLLEHPPTYTFGRRGRAENLLWDEKELDRRGIAVHWVDRGGDVTFHGPGQLVGYPLLPLTEGKLRADPETGSYQIPQADYVGYVRKLEKVLIEALMRFGVGAGQILGKTGVWVQPAVASRCRNCPPALRQAPAKIASIGVKVDAKGISRHGFALNVAPEMSYWEGIIACGLENQNQGSLAYYLDQAPPMEAVEEAVVEAFRRVFGYEMQAGDPLQTPVKARRQAPLG